MEETVLAGEIILRLADTAGIRDTDDPVEQAGVQLARKRLESAQLVLVVLDRSEPLAEGDLSLLTGLAGRPAIAVLNKSDLPPRLDDKALSGLVQPKSGNFRPYRRRSRGADAGYYRIAASVRCGPGGTPFGQ